MSFKTIQRKTKSERNQYAFWYAVGITSVIALVWVVSLQYRLDTNVDSDTIVSDTQNGAFARFWSETKQNFASVFEAMSETSKEDVSALSTVSTSENATSTLQESRTPFTLTPRATTTSPRSVLIGTSTQSSNFSE